MLDTNFNFSIYREADLLYKGGRGTHTLVQMLCGQLNGWGLSVPRGTFGW